MSERPAKYDVAYHADGPRPERHFCRSWDLDSSGEYRGCYGTNPNHGFTWEDAKAEVVRWYRDQAAYWEAMTEDEFNKQ